jgi:hypothetical protein
LIAIRPDRLAVVDGRAVLRDDQATWQLDAIDVDLTAESVEGPFALRGGFAIATQEFDIDARLGRLSPAHVGTLRLALAALGARPASLTYNGAVGWDADNPRLRGDVTLMGDDAQSAALMASDALGGAAPRPLPWLDRRFEISGALQLDRTTLLLDELRLLLDGQRADGQLDLAVGANPSIALGLRAQQLELADPLAAGLADLAPLAALSRALHGKIDLSVAALHYRDRTADRVRLRLSLAGDGEIAVEQASAILPGQTDLRFEGRLTSISDATDLRGDVDVVTDDLGALLDWLNLEPPDVATGRLRTLSLSGALAIDHDAVRLPHLELRVDATQARGSAGLAMGAGRPRFTADLVLDRLNLDAYLADLRPSNAARLLQAALRDGDATITTSVERLTWRDVQLRDVAIALRAEQGRLQVSNASLEVAGEATARLDGQVDLESGAFSWATEVHTTRLARLLRRLGLPSPLMLTRVPPLTLTVEAAGMSEQFDLEIRADDGAGKLAALGTAGWVDGGPRYDLEVELDHSDFSALVRPLGARTAVTGDAVPAALSFAGKITGAASGRTIAGAARLGSMSLTGLLAWRQEQPRPRYDLQLSVAEPTLELLMALLELTGLGPPVTLLDAPLLGNWPPQPLQLGWLSQFDGSLKLAAKGGLAGEGSELDARLQDAMLFVDRASARLRHGSLDAAFALDAGRPLPFLTGSLDLREVDTSWLAARLDLDPVIEGAMDLHSEATAAGWSAYDLVRSLIGRAELSIGQGQLRGDDLAAIGEAMGRNDQQNASVSGQTPALPFTDLVGRFSLDRGIARAQSVNLEVQGAPATVTGSADLLLWAADLTVEVEVSQPDRPITLRVVGPLGRPQTRLTVPAATARP